jgi:molybdopterin molybdotransferase
MSFEDDGQWHARLTGPQGSGVLTSMALASGFAICPENVKSIEEGQEVDVLMIGWDHQLA